MKSTSISTLGSCRSPEMNDELLLSIGYVDRWGEGRLYMCIDGGESRAWVCGSTPPCRSFAGGVLNDADEKRTIQHFDLLFASDTSNVARSRLVFFLSSIMRLGFGGCSVISTCQLGPWAATLHARPRQGICSVPQPQNRKRRSGRRIGGAIK